MVTRTNYIDRALTKFATLNRNPEGIFIADTVMPPIPVSGRTGSFNSISNGLRFASPTQSLRRASGAAFNRLNLNLTKTSAYTLEEWGIEAPVDDVDADFAADDEVSLREAATALALEDLMIERERDAAALLFSASVITQTSALASGSRWDDTGVDPRASVETAVETIQKAVGLPREMLSVLIGAEVFHKLQRSDALMQFFRATAPGTTFMTREQLAQALGLKEVFVGGAVANSAKQGQTASGAYLWGKSALVFYREASPVTQMRTRGVGFTFSHRKRGLQVERYRQEPRAEIVCASALEDRAVTNASAGYLFTTVIS